VASPSGESFTRGFSPVSGVFDEQINRKRGLLIPSILPHDIDPLLFREFALLSAGPQRVGYNKLSLIIVNNDLIHKKNNLASIRTGMVSSLQQRRVYIENMIK
jgi:hypothetical protein